MITRLLHGAVYIFQALRRSVWFFTQPQTVGVHGIPITADGKVVLVTLSYAHGWRLPGGGQKRGEDARTAMLRELREEIGMTDHDSVELVTGFEHRPDHRHGRGSLFIVRGVRYRPKWSFEVRSVAEFDLDALSKETARITYQVLRLGSNNIDKTSLGSAKTS